MCKDILQGWCNIQSSSCNRIGL